MTEKPFMTDKYPIQKFDRLLKMSGLKRKVTSKLCAVI